MTERRTIHGLQIAKALADLIEQEATPGTGITAERFWSEMAGLLDEFVPRNRELLAKRDDLQAKLDAWHQEHVGAELNAAAYKLFLHDIGYLADEGPDFEITTDNVDEEIALLAGPQLVVPMDNARYALNAANARWGSLYDALYGNDVIPEAGGADKSGAYNPVRGARVIDYAAHFLNENFPLANARHEEVTRYAVTDGALAVSLDKGAATGLVDPAQFQGYLGNKDEPSGVLLKHNGLHVEIQIDREDSVGQNEKAGVKDLLLEA
ncbi:MAG: malate synthase G, partial [Pseudomonadales bacterium]